MTDYDEAFEKLNLRFTMHNRENIWKTTKSLCGQNCKYSFILTKTIDER
jgi:hypothetical protein